MNIEIPDELNMPIVDLWRFAAEHGCYVEARFRGNHGGRMELVFIPDQSERLIPDSYVPGASVLARTEEPPTAPWPKPIGGDESPLGWVDSAGTVFDATKHATPKSGPPSVNANGTFRARRGSGSPPPSVAPEPVQEARGSIGEVGTRPSHSPYTPWKPGTPEEPASAPEKPRVITEDVEWGGTEFPAKEPAKEAQPIVGHMARPFRMSSEQARLKELGRRRIPDPPPPTEVQALEADLMRHALTEEELRDLMLGAESPDDVGSIQLAMGDIARFPVGSVQRNRLLDAFATMKRRLGV